MIQLFGVLAVGSFMLIASGLFWWMIKRLGGLRVLPDQENIGLDLSEHASIAYLEFFR